MAEARVQRRLAAILVADVVGYSRLMRADEAGTLAQLNAIRRELLNPKIAEYGGRIVKTTGDGILIEFPSAVDAVQHAVDVQQAMARRNADIGESQRMEIRIGINVGDVIVEGDDLFGDGVNVAARLEGLAEAGGICVSGNAYEQVRDKLQTRFEDLGEQHVKNIDRPVQVYRVSVGRAELAKTNGVQTDTTPLSLPDKPSIAVLPFNNMSDDPDQEYFSDGITEDIITALSRIRQFFVIARNTTFTFKDRAVDVQAVAKNLGVRYVMEGSVRKAGNRVRITAQLVDGDTGNHIWAEKYDRDLEDIFELQDELTQTVVGAIEPEMDRAERERAKLKSPENLNTWDLYQRGMSQLYDSDKWGKRDHQEQARILFEKAIHSDPNFAPAHASLAETYASLAHSGTSESRQDNFEKGLAAARRAIELDENASFAHQALGTVLMFARRHEEAISRFEQAINLNPNSAKAIALIAAAMTWSGKAAGAIPYFESAMRLSPRDPMLTPWIGMLAQAYMQNRQYAEALEWKNREMTQPGTVFWADVCLVSILGHMGRLSEAKDALATLLRRKPEFNCQYLQNNYTITDAGYMDHFLEGLRKAGVPEGDEVEDEPPPLPDKPSIAVLPFDNMSGDPDQEYFSDGITEDIITSLSRIRQFFVIARNTTFTYRGQAVDVQDVARELGVRYVLEGSIRRAGDRIRVTAQLIDGETGNHIWAERYDRNLEDIFELQDEITTTVVGAIQPELSRAEQSRARRKPSENLDAWDLYQKGVWHSWRLSKEDHAAAQLHLQRAIELDPEFCPAYAFLAFTMWRTVPMGFTDAPKDTLDKALEIAKQAIALDNSDAHAHWAMGVVCMQRREHELAQEELERAIELNPSFASAYQWLGWTMAYDRQPEEGIRKVREAQRLSPNDPSAWGMILIQAQANLNMKEFAEAERLAQQAKRMADNLFTNCVLLASMGHTGKTEDAETVLQDLFKVAPKFTVQGISEVFPFRHQKDLDIWEEGLRLAGVPEG